MTLSGSADRRGDLGVTKVGFSRQLAGAILLLVVLAASACGPTPEPTRPVATPGETLALAPTPIPPTATSPPASPSPPPTATLVPTHTPRPTEATPQAITPENAAQVALLEVLGQGPLSGMALLPGGQTLATGSGFGTLRLWDVGTGALLREIDVTGSNASRAAFSPGSDLLVSISSGFEPDYAVRLWAAESGDLLRTLEGHHKDVTDLAFGPGGRLLATSDQDGRILVWDLAAGEALRTLEQGRWVTSIAFHVDGAQMATGGYDALIRVWGVP